MQMLFCKLYINKLTILANINHTCILLVCQYRSHRIVKGELMHSDGGMTQICLFLFSSQWFFIRGKRGCCVAYLSSMIPRWLPDQLLLQLSFRTDCIHIFYKMVKIFTQPALLFFFYYSYTCRSFYAFEVFFSHRCVLKKKMISVHRKRDIKCLISMHRSIMCFVFIYRSDLKTYQLNNKDSLSISRLFFFSFRMEMIYRVNCPKCSDVCK